MFCRYLVGRKPDAYVRSCYCKAHDLGVVDSAGAGRWDRLVVRIAGTSTWMTRLADAHTRAFGGSLMRKKLVLMLAIVENSPGFHHVIDAVTYRTRFGFLVAAGCTTLISAVALATGTLLFLPMRLACAFLRDNRQEQR